MSDKWTQGCFTEAIMYWVLKWGDPWRALLLNSQNSIKYVLLAESVFQPGDTSTYSTTNVISPWCRTPFTLRLRNTVFVTVQGRMVDWRGSDLDIFENKYIYIYNHIQTEIYILYRVRAPIQFKNIVTLLFNFVANRCNSFRIVSVSLQFAESYPNSHMLAPWEISKMSH